MRVMAWQAQLSQKEKSRTRSRLYSIESDVVSVYGKRDMLGGRQAVLA